MSSARPTRSRPPSAGRSRCEAKGTPSVLALSRQNLPQVRSDRRDAELPKAPIACEPPSAARKVVLVATGSEVERRLRGGRERSRSRASARTSSRCRAWSCSNSRTTAYRADLFPADALKVSIEAGTTLGWERYTGTDGLQIGLDRFGASAPAEELFEKFGFTAEAIVPKILDKLN